MPTDLLWALVGLIIGFLFFFHQRAMHQVTEKHWEVTQCRLVASQAALKAEKTKNILLIQQISVLKTTNQHLLEKIDQAAQQTQNVDDKLLLEFKNLSNELLEQKSEKFTKQSKEQIAGILLPLREKLADFQKQTINIQQSSRESTLMLKQEYEKVNTLYEKMRKEAELATRAIMGDNKLQGTWGETHAMRLLENTGLRKDEQYFVQQGFATQEGKRCIPDITIKLPGGRNIVMDVKVSLINYVKFFNATDNKERTSYLKKHLLSIKNHIKRLSEKNYAQLYELDGLDFVLLLLPVEPAFSLAIQHQPSLFQEAYERNILLVSPTTLQATLCMIEHVWKNAARNKHALEIARQGGILYDKFVGFVEDFRKLGDKLSTGQKSYEQAMKKLCGGRGNLISKAERLRELGARTSKQLNLNAETILEEVPKNEVTSMLLERT